MLGCLVRQLSLPLSLNVVVHNIPSMVLVIIGGHKVPVKPSLLVLHMFTFKNHAQLFLSRLKFFFIKHMFHFTEVYLWSYYFGYYVLVKLYVHDRLYGLSEYLLGRIIFLHVGMFWLDVSV